MVSHQEIRLMNRLSGSMILGAIAVLTSAFASSSLAADEPSAQNPGVFAREIWTRPGTPESLKDGTAFQGEPQRRELVTAPVGATDAGDGFVQRIRGWVEVPTTGAYRFAIAADNDAVLLVAPGGDPAKAEPVATVEDFSGPMSFEQPGQTSKAITLIKGQRCYIEARHRDVKGPDHLIVAWRVPRSAFDRPMPIGASLEPAFTMDVWNGVAEADPTTIPAFETKPARTVALVEAATPRDIGSNVAVRIRGDWTAPADGEYVFMLSGDDRSWLAVRPGGKPGAEPLGTAALSSWTETDSFEGRAGQTTSPIRLRKGEVVSLEARLWQGTGPGHLAIGVKGGGADQRPIISPIVFEAAADRP
jgi:hypothetical protein